MPTVGINGGSYVVNCSSHYNRMMGSTTNGEWTGFGF